MTEQRLFLREGTPVDFPELLAVWEASVRATHAFLSEEDLFFYREQLREHDFFSLRLLLLCDGTGRIVAFAGVDGDSLEMLFVRPDCRGGGAGERLVRFVTERYGVMRVDVNEQNGEAVGFYGRMGFRITGCDPLDGWGKPYPILHMRFDGIRIRRGEEADIPRLQALFRESVLRVCAADYTAEECADWASCGDDPAHWRGLMARLTFAVAETPGGEMAGFASLRADGYLHSMFVGADFLRQGIATRLLEAMERRARRRGVARIVSEVSLTARPFFEKRGYRVTAEQSRRANRLSLKNFRMEKTIS